MHAHRASCTEHARAPPRTANASPPTNAGSPQCYCTTSHSDIPLKRHVLTRYIHVVFIICLVLCNVCSNCACTHFHAPPCNYVQIVGLRKYFFIAQVLGMGQLVFFGASKFFLGGPVSFQIYWPPGPLDPQA